MTDIDDANGAAFAPGWVHPAAEIPERGLEVRRQASEEERARLAAALDIRACTALDVSYRITPRTGERYRLVGRIEAHLVQRCVVTLAPVEATLREPLEVDFRGGRDGDDLDEARDPAVIFNRDFEPVRRGLIDVGRVVFEHIAACLDPYPRAPGAVFDWEAVQARHAKATGGGGSADAPPDNPFAVLRRLKRDG